MTPEEIQKSVRDGVIDAAFRLFLIVIGIAIGVKYPSIVFAVTVIVLALAAIGYGLYRLKKYLCKRPRLLRALFMVAIPVLLTGVFVLSLLRR